MTASIYLDYAAATPLDTQVLAAMQPLQTEQFYNPSAAYLAARDVSKTLAEARAKVAHWLGARPSEVIFTAGGTEANNLAIHGIMRQFSRGHMVVSGIEHESVLVPAHQYDCTEVGVTSEGVVDLAQLEAAITDNTMLVSIMYANNEIGTIQSLKDIRQVIDRKLKERETRNKKQKTGSLPLYLHTDACQAANYLDLQVARLGVDLMTLNGGKIYGPKQSGVLFVGSQVKLQPLILGGGQERNLRSGTENVAQSVGLAIALDLAQQLRHEESRRLQELQKRFIELLEQKIPNCIINGSRKKRLPNNVHVTIPGSDNERLLMQLDEVGVMAAAGSACSASNEEPSHVLRVLGLSDTEAQASLRFTMGRQTTVADIERTVEALQRFAV